MAIKHTVRDRAGGTEVKTLTARSAIRHHCRECMGWNAAEVRRCTSPLCALFPFRTRDKVTECGLDEIDEEDDSEEEKVIESAL